MKKSNKGPLPCPKCKSKDIEIMECGYSTFNVGHGKCCGCGYEITTVYLMSWGKHAEKEVIHIWNKKVKKLNRKKYLEPFKKRALKKLTALEKEALGFQS